MANPRVSTGGKQSKTGYYDDPVKAGINYGSELSKQSRSNSKYFRNFFRTKGKAYMTTVDDTQHLFISLTVLSNLTAGDPATAILKYIDEAWELGAKTGNIKDVDDDQETAFKSWVRYWLVIAWEIAAQAMLRPFLGAVTESSTTATTESTVAIWKTSDWESFISSLERLECPDFIYNFMKPFLWYVRMTDKYDKAKITIPPSYFIPIAYQYAMATCESRREATKAVMADAMTHCRKFGIPFSKFSLDKLKAKEVARKDVYFDQDIIAYLGFAPYYYTWKTGPTPTRRGQSASLTGANLTTDFTNILYMFDDTKDMSILHALYPLFGTVYEADNNPYGEIITMLSSGAAEYTVNMLHMKILGTSWTQGLMSGLESIHILKMFVSFWTGDTDFGLCWRGDEITSAILYLGAYQWPGFDENPHMCIGNGAVKGEEAIDAAKFAAKCMIYGE